MTVRSMAGGQNSDRANHQYAGTVVEIGHKVQRQQRNQSVAHDGAAGFGVPDVGCVV